MELLAGVGHDLDHGQGGKALGAAGGVIGGGDLHQVHRHHLAGLADGLQHIRDVLEIKAKGIDLSYINYADKDILVIADAEQLKRVINNIIGNSLKYMDKKHGIINIRLLDVGDFVQIEIEDNGKGIGQKELPYIFDRFYRTDSSRNSSKGGSGIGLSIVKKIIEDHGGKIWATSKEGIGTEIHFVLRKIGV